MKAVDRSGNQSMARLACRPVFSDTSFRKQSENVKRAAKNLTMAAGAADSQSYRPAAPFCASENNRKKLPIDACKCSGFLVNERLILDLDNLSRHNGVMTWYFYSVIFSAVLSGKRWAAVKAKAYIALSIKRAVPFKYENRSIGDNAV